MSKVLIIIGSKSDMEYAQKCDEQLEKLGIEGVIKIGSAHRHPEKVKELASQAKRNGFDVVIAMAGLAAALPGVVASYTLLPVIGVPLPAALNGLDSLFSIAQMPAGIPVAAMAIGSHGAKNAAVMAARIIALKDKEINDKLTKHRDSL